jgi:RNA polymerase sigma-70 factor, ECF subfamily
MSSSPDLQSAAELFSLHAGFVATFARRLGTELVDVDDLVQETFLVVHRHGGFAPGEAKATTWLAAITLRLFKNRRRSAARKPTTVLADDTMAPGSPVERLEARSSLKRVQTSLMEMDAEHRAVFVLFELQEQSCEDIAQAMQIPVGTVYSRLHKARKKFLSAYNQMEILPSSPAPYPRGQEL